MIEKEFLCSLDGTRLMELWNEYVIDAGCLDEQIYPFNEIGIRNMMRTPLVDSPEEFVMKMVNRSSINYGFHSYLGFIDNGEDYSGCTVDSFENVVDGITTYIGEEWTDFLDWLNKEESLDIYKAVDDGEYTNVVLKYHYGYGELLSIAFHGLVYGINAIETIAISKELPSEITFNKERVDA